jgi:hypothetical protein
MADSRQESVQYSMDLSYDTIRTTPRPDVKHARIALLSLYNFEGDNLYTFCLLFDNFRKELSISYVADHAMFISKF